MHDKKQSKVLRDKGDNLLIESERERERERLRSAEEEESKQRGMELKHRSEKEAEIEKEKVREKIVSMKVQNEVENDVVVVHKARKKASNAASSVTSSRSVSPVPLYPGPQIPSQSVCMSLQSSQKVNPENSRSNRELLLLQRKQGGADRKQGSVEQNIVEMRHGRSDGMRNEEVEGGTMDSHSNTIHRTLSHSNNRIKSNHNSAYRINTKEKEKERETHKHRDDECPTDGEGGSDVDVLADSLVPIKDLQLHLAFFGTMIDGLNTEVENTDLEGSESFGLDSMYLRNKKFDTNKTPHISKEEETEIIIEIVKEKETVKIEIDKYDIEIKNDHRQPHSRLKQMILENDDRGTFDLLQDTLPEVQAKDKEKDTEKEKERIEDLKRLLKPSTSAFSIGNMAVYERDHGSEFQKKESRRNSYQSNLAQPVRKDRGPVISGGVGLFKNLEIESNMSNISSRRASTGSDGGVWSEAPGERGAGVGDLGGGGGSRLLGSAQLKQSLPPSIHDLLRMSPADACDTGRDREEKGRDREERGRDREERGREEWVGDGRGHAEEKQDEERARRIFNDKEKERDKIRSIERDRDRELSRERADVVDYGLVARKKEKEHERLLLREAEKEKSKEWEREKVKQARERLKKDAEEEEKHQQLMQQRSPQNVEPRVRPTGRNERGEGGNIDNVAPTSGGVGGGGERDVKKGALRDKEEVLRSEKERIDAVDRKKGPGRPDERGAGRESRIPKEDVDEESLLVAELLALERRQKTTLRIEDGRKRTDSGIQPPSSRDSDKARSSHGRESQLPARSGKSLARSESTPRPTRSEGVKEKVAFGPGARDVRKPDNFKSTSEAPGMLKSKSVASVSAGNRGKEKDNERDKDKDREMEREREREQGKVKKEQVAVIPTAQPDLVHLKACTPTQEEVDNEEDLQSPVSRNSSVGGNKGKMKKIMPDIQENQPAIEDGGGYLQEYRKKHADKEKEKGGLGGGGLGVAGLGGGGKVLRRRHSDMHQQGDVGREREKEREEYGGESPNVMHISSGTQSLGHKHDRRVVSKSRVAEEDSLSLPPILPASVTLEGSGRHPVDKKRNRSGGTASAPSRLRHDAASSLRATPGFEPEAPVLPNPIRVSHDYGTPNGHSPILQNSSRIGKKIPVR